MQIFTDEYLEVEKMNFASNVISALAIAAAAMSLTALAQQPAGTPQVQPTAGQIQSVVAIRGTWTSLLEALVRKDHQRAASLLLPERRAEFLEFLRTATSLNRAGEMLERVRAVLCGLDSESAGQCTVTLPTPAGGIEEVTIPFLKRDGTWYIDF